MVSDQAELRLSSPHEGRCQLTLSPSIVGLMRNSLSEAGSGDTAICFYPECRTCLIALVGRVGANE